MTLQSLSDAELREALLLKERLELLKNKKPAKKVS